VRVQRTRENAEVKRKESAQREKDVLVRRSRQASQRVRNQVQINQKGEEP